MGVLRHAEMQWRSWERYMQYLRKKSVQHGVEVPPVTEAVSRFVRARVNWGRWVVECPCGNVEFAWRKIKRHMCSCCWNAEHEGKWLKVRWPAARDEIETVLLKRPYPKNRNWRGESIQELEAENAEHGIA